MALALRNLLRSSARRLQVRSYAAEAPKEGEMALTFAAGNKVTIIDLNSVICQIEIIWNYFRNLCNEPSISLLCIFFILILYLIAIKLTTYLSFPNFPHNP